MAKVVQSRKMTVPAVPGIMSEPVTVEVETVSAGHYRVYHGERFVGIVRRVPVRSKRCWQLEPATGAPYPIKMLTRDDAVACLMY